MANEHQLQLMAAFVHGFLLFGHGLGMIYNAKRRNRVDMAVHSLAVLYHLRSTYKHIQAAKAAGV